MKKLIFVSFVLVINLCSPKVKTMDELDIYNLNQERIYARFGEPDNIYTLDYYYDKSLYEYQSSLSEIDIKEGDTIKIKELSWVIDSEKLVIWLWRKNEEWVVYDGLQWNPNEIKF